MPVGVTRLICAFFTATCCSMRDMTSSSQLDTFEIQNLCFSANDLVMIDSHSKGFR
ncbi:hypothetical protein BURMUCGD2M_6055 [Burkholderia multivorans CGD2M]|uniref:Uncharacterized protein n=1 Tax=Burkholderia multivorans CGD2 TaxID=513052 RepID=B9BLV6_9BURK|nr:hypothetical protein BURMUCGD2_6064 [Burkholderia multivorans CGD2]EEE16610.1 hypothetical protein BURMUCGD2M_6055 [Burkholderia multivorans CGD2M]